MAIDPRLLGVFRAVASEGSLSRASRLLNMSQPAVTKALKRLEQQAAVKLCERHATGVSLTAAGHIMLPYAELVASEIQGLEERINAYGGQGRSTLRIGAVASVAASILPDALTRLLAAEPGFGVEVIEGIDDSLMTALREKEIDLAIAGHSDDSADIQQALRGGFEDELVVIASRQHPLVAQDNLRLEDLMPFPWVLPPSTVAPMVEFLRRFAAAGLRPPQAQIETRSVSTIRAIVASSNFLSWQPRALFMHAADEPRIVALPVEAVRFERRFHVLRRSKGVLAPAAQMFITVLRQSLLGGDPVKSVRQHLPG